KKVFQQRFVSSKSNQRLSEKDSFLFPTKINEYNNNENPISFITSERESWTKNHSSTTYIDTNETETSKEQLIIEDIDVDIDELIDADEPSISIVYFPSTRTKPISNISIDK
ncbi:unnamed protein product, partial [Rotaria magnacalcarata]